MNITASTRAAALALSVALGFGLCTASIADDFEESYWYASGDPSVPDGQLWTTSYGECWQSAYPDGPTNLPPCRGGGSRNHHGRLELRVRQVHRPGYRR
jgi:hypothetical protein